MNALLNKIIEERSGHYCHAVEVSTVYDLENIAEAIVGENEDEFAMDIIIDFLESLTVYYLPQDGEEEDKEEEERIYNFSFAEYINANN